MARLVSDTEGSNPPIPLRRNRLPNDLERQLQQLELEHLLCLPSLPVGCVAQVMQPLAV
jgi:hypothetical protein